MSNIETTAYHEAGHVWAAAHLGARVRSVTICPDWDDGPERFGDTQVEWPWERFTSEDISRGEVLVSLAGPVAEMIHRGESWHPGLVSEWAEDWQTAWQAAAPLITSDRARLRFLERTTGELWQLLNNDRQWALLAGIVDHLLAHETLDFGMLEEILARDGH